MAEKARELELLTRRQFSDPDVVERYSKVGLYPSEELLVRRFFKPGTKVLDVGCGAGRTANALGKIGYKVHGIDLVPEMIESAQYAADINKYEVTFQVMDAGNMTFDEGTFENVISTFNVLDQIPGREKREKVLKDVYRFCKPGGYFILGSRSGFSARRLIAWPWICLQYLYERYVRGNDYELGDKKLQGKYYHYMNPFYVKRLCKQIGFNLVYFNSEKRLVSGRKANWLINFSGDRMLLYVFKRT